MPEATMNLDNSMKSSEYDIRPAGELPVVQAKAEPQGVKKTSDLPLRIGVLPADARHHSTAGGSIHDIHRSRLGAERLKRERELRPCVCFLI